jgi:hypothetical protein
LRDAGCVSDAVFGHFVQALVTRIARSANEEKARDDSRHGESPAHEGEDRPKIMLTDH